MSRLLDLVPLLIGGLAGALAGGIASYAIDGRVEPPLVVALLVATLVTSLIMLVGAGPARGYGWRSYVGPPPPSSRGWEFTGGKGPVGPFTPPVPAPQARYSIVSRVPGPFDRFDDSAKRILALAQDEAIRFNHDYIGTEHLLLGLVREGEGVAARVLDSLGVELSKVRVSVEHIIGRGKWETPPSDITLSPRTKKVIELATDEARKLGQSHVGTEHLLLGLVREGGGIATNVLQSLGVSLEKVRHQTIATLGQQTPPAPPAEWAWAYDAQGRKRDWYCEDVLSGTLSVRVVYEDERVLAFHHPHPEAEVHVAIVPISHLASMLDPSAVDGNLLSSMVRAVQHVARSLELEGRGFQLRANAGSPHVTPHMHWHLISGAVQGRGP